MHVAYVCTVVSIKHNILSIKHTQTQRSYNRITKSPQQVIQYFLEYKKMYFKINFLTNRSLYFSSYSRPYVVYTLSVIGINLFQKSLGYNLFLISSSSSYFPFSHYSFPFRDTKSLPEIQLADKLSSWVWGETKPQSNSSFHAYWDSSQKKTVNSKTLI